MVNVTFIVDNITKHDHSWTFIENIIVLTYARIYKTLEKIFKKKEKERERWWERKREIKKI